MIGMLGDSTQITHSSARHNLTKTCNKNMEEIIIERGIISVFKALVRNVNSIVYEVKIKNVF